jgi:L-asparaginase
VEPIVVEVTRGATVEARHVVHAVAVRDGRIELAAGDPGLVTFLRSAAKPLQALPVVRARPELDDEEVALICASHLATPEQVAVVRRILADAPAGEGEFECGPDPTPIEHNCSGKHAGFLCVCAAQGWPFENYRLRRHPLQIQVLAAVDEAAALRGNQIPVAVDGCGVPTFGLSLARMAASFGRLVRSELEGADRVTEAMRAHPALVEGPGSAATEVMQAVPGSVAKGGAEGVLCVGLDDGSALALKAEDGSSRGLLPAAAALLDLTDLRVSTIRNSRGEAVGEVVVES